MQNSKLTTKLEKPQVSGLFTTFNSLQEKRKELSNKIEDLFAVNKIPFITGDKHRLRQFRNS
jgi:hypothetical protein